MIINDPKSQGVEVMKKYKKAVVNILFIGVLLGLTLYFLLKDQEIPQILAAMERVKPGWLAVGLICVLIFVCGESVIINYLMRSLKYRAPLLQCIKYSFVGFFFSCVTPSATGGQPAQVYYMKKDGLDISVSSLVLMVVTVAYKAVLLILGGLAFVTQPVFVCEHLGNVIYILIYGIVVNIAFITFLLMVIFKTSLARSCARTVTGWLGRWGVLKNPAESKKKVEQSLEKYHQAAVWLKGHKMAMFHVLWITMLQRMALFAVTWLVYRSFGLGDAGLWQIIALQTMISLSVDMLPLPGGIGASETSFIIMFEKVFGQSLVLPGMLLSRGISYYALVLISGAVTCGAHLYSQRGERKKI